VRLGAGPGKKIAIVGLGGLGHFAVMFAKALGAEVYVLSHSPDKKDDALKMGAKEFILTSDQDWHKPYAFAFDFIINTADAVHKFKLPDYFSTLKVMGRFHCVGFGDYPLPEMMAQDFAPNGCYFGASHIGNRPEMLSMLDLAAKQGIKSWIQTVPISKDGCAEAVRNVNDNKVRYRYVLTDYDKEFGNRT
jgi:alcohol dehydrogenase (NADP+)